MIDGNDEPQRQIVPAGPKPSVRPAVLFQGLLWTALGAAACPYLPYLGVFLLAYGMRELLEAKKIKGLCMGLAVCVAAFAATCALDFTLALSLVPVFVCAAGISWCMWRGRAGVTSVCFVIVVASLLSLGIDAIIASMSGTSLSKSFIALLQETVRSTVGSDIQGDLLASQVMPLLRVIWPFVYVASAMFDALVAGIGSYTMAVRCTGVRRMPQIANFDAPMWCVGALALCILGLGVSFAGIPQAQLVRTVCATVLCSLRVVFVLQGFGVVSALETKRRMGCLTRFLITVLTVWLETMFFAMCIVGLIDIWANFRGLAREQVQVDKAKQ